MYICTVSKCWCACILFGLFPYTIGSPPPPPPPLTLSAWQPPSHYWTKKPSPWSIVHSPQSRFCSAQCTTGHLITPTFWIEMSGKSLPPLSYRASSRPPQPHTGCGDQSPNPQHSGTLTRHHSTGHTVTAVTAGHRTNSGHRQIPDKVTMCQVKICH